MPFSTLTKVATSVAVLAATIPAAAAAQPGSAPVTPSPVAPAGQVASGRHVPDLPQVASPTARQLLEEARAVFTERRDVRGRASGPVPVHDAHEATMTLLQLQLRKRELTPAERDEVDVLTSRPTHSDSTFTYPADTRLRSQCSERICVHWPTSGGHAPPSKDGDGDGVPDQVETTLATIEHLWQRIVDQGGYKAPKRDRGKKADPDQGPDRRFDVYLADVARYNLFGYCTIDPVTLRKVRRQGWDVPGYCVLDNDFSPAQYGSSKSALDLLRVTAAHEFFHAVQFSYDIGEDPWFMEGTAAWVEDEIYDGVNDNLAFLPRSQLSRPTKSLDFGKGLSVYGSWVWWRYLTERFPGTAGSGLPALVRDVWRRADASASDPSKRGTYSLRALKAALANRKAPLPRTYARFGLANRNPARAYEEGGSYPTAPLLESYRLTADQPRIAEQVATMPHLTNFSVAFRPDGGIGEGWRLLVRVDGPPRKRGSVAHVVVVRTDGGRSTRMVKLNAKGRGSRAVSFDGGAVRRVELTLTNAGSRFRCNRDTVFSCAGRSRDDGAKFFFTARAVRPKS